MSVLTQQHVSVPAPPVDEPWAPWHLRVAASLVDAAVVVPFLVAMFVVGAISEDHPADQLAQMICFAAFVTLAVSLFVFQFWNSVVRQGHRGASLGKECFGLLVISLGDARPIGPALTLVRRWAHLVDAVTLGLGYLWPLADRRRQTFADKIMFTVVLRLPDVRF